MIWGKKKKDESQSQLSKPPKSSPRKRKAPVENSQTLNLNPNIGTPRSSVPEPVENAANDCGESVEISISDQIVDAHVENSKSNSNNADSNGALAVNKKPRVSISPDDSLLELKKKAANFKVKKAAR
ncbi:hypothetical protein CASFOL_026742 [Castilleja foliolosa]|uniref:Uncharacterized protein n=1 Tax=Castilleja foliolosa TaxID=1961234 RepID=A0ABD3CHX0_9LAMI